MCGRSSAAMAALIAASAVSTAAQSNTADNIVQGFGGVPASEVKPGFGTVRGAKRGEAVAAYLDSQSAELASLYMLTAEGSAANRAVQAGAAAAEALAGILRALNSGDKLAFKQAFTSLVNDAVDSGIVTLGHVAHHPV